MRHAQLIAASALVVAALSPAPIAQKAQPVRGPVTLFLTARTGQPVVTAEELALRKDRLRAASTAEGQLVETYRQQHGRIDKWPTDAVDAYWDAFYKSRTAASDIWCANVSDKDLADSLENLKGDVASRAKKGWVQGVEARDEADLVIEVLGRSTQVRSLGDALFKRASFLGGSRVVTYEIRPGRIGPDIVATLPASWPRKRLDQSEAVQQFPDHWFTAAEPFFRFTVGDNARWGLVSFNASHVINEFVKDNYTILKQVK